MTQIFYPSLFRVLEAFGADRNISWSAPRIYHEQPMDLFDDGWAGKREPTSASN
jgi:hypothetical protein